MLSSERNYIKSHLGRYKIIHNINYYIAIEKENKETGMIYLILEHHPFSYGDKEHYTTNIGRPLAGLVATSIPKPSNGSYLLRRYPTPTLPASYLTLQISARKPAR
jgi:hypothetical protein